MQSSLSLSLSLWRAIRGRASTIWRAILLILFHWLLCPGSRCAPFVRHLISFSAYERVDLLYISSRAKNHITGFLDLARESVWRKLESAPRTANNLRARQCKLKTIPALFIYVYMYIVYTALYVSMSIKLVLLCIRRAYADFVYGVGVHHVGGYVII